MSPTRLTLLVVLVVLSGGGASAQEEPAEGKPCEPGSPLCENATPITPELAHDHEHAGHQIHGEEASSVAAGQSNEVPAAEVDSSQPATEPEAEPESEPEPKPEPVCPPEKKEMRCPVSGPNGDSCGGAAQGVCECGACRCLPGWQGRGCSERVCPPREATPRCRAEGADVDCSGRGRCVCGECECVSHGFEAYTGDFCHICPTCPAQCSDYAECVEQRLFAAGLPAPLGRFCQSLQLEVMQELGPVPDSEQKCRVSMRQDDRCRFEFTMLHDVAAMRVNLRAAQQKICFAEAAEEPEHMHEGLFHGVKEAVGDFFADVKQNGHGMFHDVKEESEDLFHSAKDASENFYNDSKEAGEGFINDAKKVHEDLLSGAKDAAEDASTELKRQQEMLNKALDISTESPTTAPSSEEGSGAPKLMACWAVLFASVVLMLRLN